MIRNLLSALALLPLLSASAAAGDWFFQPGDYSHHPYTGQRVIQYAPQPPAYYRFYNDYAQSGYRHTNSTLRVGSSVDRAHFTETWGGGGLAFASAWLWRGFNEDFVYPNDLSRHRHGRGFSSGHGHLGHGAGFGPHGFAPHGGFHGHSRGHYSGQSGIVSFDKDGATIGWDNYGGGWSGGFHRGGYGRPGYRVPWRP